MTLVKLWQDISHGSLPAVIKAGPGVAAGLRFWGQATRHLNAWMALLAVKYLGLSEKSMRNSVAESFFL